MLKNPTYAGAFAYGRTQWEQYLENQRILKSNRTKSHDVSSGAAKKGSALLSGLLRCARCGHKLHVAYRSRPGEAPRYYCMTGNKEQGKPSCLCFAAYKVEKAVVEMALEACQPMGIEASLQVLTAESIEQIRRHEGWNWPWREYVMRPSTLNDNMRQ